MLKNKIPEHILVIQQTILPPKEISSIKEDEVNFAKNRSFKDFTTNWKKRNWIIIFNILLVTFIWMATISQFFHSERSTLVTVASSKFTFNGLQIESTHIFSIRIAMLPCPCALIKARFLLTFPISSTENVTVDKRL